MWMCWRVGGWGGCRGRRRTVRIVCTRRAGRIRTGPHMRCGGAGRDGAVTWQPRSMSTVWPPGQVFALRRCAAACIRRVCGTTVVTAWLWPGGKIPTSTPTGSRSATTITAVRCQPGPVSRGATVRWHGHANQPEPDTAPPSVNEPPNGGQLWGGLIAYQPSYTTSARESSSDARPSGDAPRKQISAKQGVVGRGPPTRQRQRWTPERHNYQTRVASGSWAGPDVGWVGSDLARRFGWHVAEQAALEVDRVVQLGRPVQNPQGLATHFARCFARPQLCHRRHQGDCGDMRLNQHRGRRLDEQLKGRTPHNDHSSPTGPAPTPTPTAVESRLRQPVPVTATEPRVIDEAQLEAALARLPKPLATQLARLATRHRITRSPNQQTAGENRTEPHDPEATTPVDQGRGHRKGIIR